MQANAAFAMQAHALRAYAPVGRNWYWLVKVSALIVDRIRGGGKTFILLVSLLACEVRFLLLQMRVRAAQRRALTLRERAEWLHRCCRRIQRRLGITLHADGALPAQGLIVSNHLSHLDILLYGALGPVVFVAKKDVQRWPLLGRLSANGGTVFVDRERGTQAITAARQMEELLRADLPVVLFPEGTSSDGACVLPFHAPLFAPAVRADALITAAAIAYAADGVRESTLTYWGDKVFATHLYQTLACRRLAAQIRFAPSAHFSDRKAAALTMHGCVEELRAQLKAAHALHMVDHAHAGLSPSLPHTGAPRSS